ncbi:MAG: hypothetical protein ACOH2K_00230 [Burkholderiaceae bacterium]
MILNHKTAIELLVENAGAVGLDRYTLMNLHSALSENLLPNPAEEGRIRQHAVEIGMSVYRPLSAPQQIDEALDLLLEKASQIVDPFEQSFFIKKLTRVETSSFRAVSDEGATPNSAMRTAQFVINVVSGMSLQRFMRFGSAPANPAYG